MFACARRVCGREAWRTAGQPHPLNAVAELNHRAAVVTRTDDVNVLDSLREREGRCRAESKTVPVRHERINGNVGSARNVKPETRQRFVVESAERVVAAGWQIATRPEHHEQIRAYLKSRPSAKLSLASLETLAVIAYKQPVTVPEILEIRGVQSPSAIKTLLDKRLIVAKGRKETVGRPMMYGTSKEFLIQFGLKDLSELPSIEDFQDLAGGAES